MLKRLIFIFLFSWFLFRLDLAFSLERQDNELLKLSLKVFVENNDLENAYKVALKGYKNNSKDIFWLKWLADISLWQGKVDLAFAYYKKIYSLKPSLSLRNKIIELGLKTNKPHQIVKFLEEKVKSKDYRYVENLLQAYIYMGVPENIFKVLDRLPSKIAFNYYPLASEVAFSLGELDKSIFYLQKIQEKRKFNSVELNLWVRILLLQKKFEKALQYLITYKEQDISNDLEYWYNLSDLAWILQKDELVFKASLYLFEQKKARKVDIERLGITALRKNNLDLAKKAYLWAWEKYREPAYFFSYAYILEKEKKYKELYLKIAKLSEEETSILESDKNFWLLKALALRYVGKYKQALDIYLDLYITYRQSSIAELYIYALIDAGRVKELKSFLTYLDSNKLVDTKLTLAVASGFNYLQNSNKAIFYYDRYLERYPNQITFLIDYADILSSVEEYEARAKKLRKRAYELIVEKINQDKDFLKDSDNLYNYLRLAIYFETPKKIKKILARAKQVLPLREYLNLYYSYLLSRGSYEKALFLKNKYKLAPPWVKLSLALEEESKDDLYYLTNTFFYRLPIRDEVEGLRRSGQIDRSKKVAWYNLENNQRDFLLYKQFKDLIEESEDKIKIHSEVNFSNNYDIFISNIQAWSDWNKYLSSEILVEDRGIRERDSALKNIPYNIRMLGISLLYKREDLQLKASIWKLKKEKEIVGGQIEGFKYLQDGLEAFLRIYINAKAEDNLVLEAGAVREGIGVGLVYNLTNAWQIEASSEINRYRDLDNNIFGNSLVNFFQISRRLRAGYPSLTLRNYWLYSTYEEKNSSYLQRFAREEVDLLPADYWEVGLALDFGLENRDNYNRVWRPFGEVGVSYNNQNGFGPSLELGIGGSLLGQDNLALGMSYSKRLSDEGEDLYRFYLDYNYWF